MDTLHRTLHRSDALQLTDQMITYFGFYGFSSYEATTSTGRVAALSPGTTTHFGNAPVPLGDPARLTLYGGKGVTGWWSIMLGRAYRSCI